MAVTLKLEKGQKIELEKVAPGLENIHIGLSWDPRKTDGQAFDLDASVLCLDASGKIKSNDDIVYYNNRSAYDNAIVHHGDNLTGETVMMKLLILNYLRFHQKLNVCCLL